MQRMRVSATTALALAGGVYLSAAPAHAGNMGFKLERSFAVVRENPADLASSFQNIYLVSFPLLNGLPDVGNSGAAGDACAAGPDTIIDSTDVICDLFTERSIRGNSFAVNRFDRDLCLFQTHLASVGPFGCIMGGAPFPLERDAGLWITVASSVVPPPQNPAVLVGSHDPTFTGREIRQPRPDCLPRMDIINLPYHSTYQKADEILCGLEGVDWFDADSNGNPDTCTRGIYDGVHSISVLTFDNVNDDSILTQDNAFASRSTTFSFGQLRFSGSNFNLVTGDAYLVAVSPGHVTRTFLAPHF